MLQSVSKNMKDEQSAVSSVMLECSDCDNDQSYVSLGSGGRGVKQINVKLIRIFTRTNFCLINVPSEGL